MVDDALLCLCSNVMRCLYGIPYTGVTYGVNGTLRYYKHGRLHREDGPAVERADGTKEWWLHGKEIKTWKEYHKLSKLSPQDQMIVKLRYGEQLK